MIPIRTVCVRFVFPFTQYTLQILFPQAHTMCKLNFHRAICNTCKVGLPCAQRVQKLPFMTSCKCCFWCEDDNYELSRAHISNECCLSIILRTHPGQYQGFYYLQSQKLIYLSAKWVVYISSKKPPLYPMAVNSDGDDLYKHIYNANNITTAPHWEERYQRLRLDKTGNELSWASDIYSWSDFFDFLMISDFWRDHWARHMITDF